MEKPHNPDFTRFWIGETISMFGSAITELALPLTAVVVQQATPAQMGALAAASYAPFLLIGLLAGVLGEYVGLQTTVLVAAAGVLVATAWMYFSPVRTLKE